MQLSDLTPDQLQALVALAEAQGDAIGRTGARKFLHDLREPTNPKARLNRPSFFWSADADPNAKPYTHQAYPKLMFRLEDDQVVETVVFTQAAEQALGDRWSAAPPLVERQSSEDAVMAELASLSEEDRAAVLESQRQARLVSITSRLDKLSDAALARVTGQPKRGPGRPKRAHGDGA